MMTTTLPWQMLLKADPDLFTLVRMPRQGKEVNWSLKRD